jgi:hypothetical protein
MKMRNQQSPEDVMCIAIDGESPTWINATVTVKQIRKVFAREPCLACVIGKRNHDRFIYRLKHKDDKPDEDPKPLETKNEKSNEDLKPTTIIPDEEISINASKIDLHVHPPGECLSADVIPNSIENDIEYYALFTDVETGYLLICLFCLLCGLVCKCRL